MENILPVGSTPLPEPAPVLNEWGALGLEAVVFRKIHSYGCGVLCLSNAREVFLRFWEPELGNGGARTWVAWEGRSRGGCGRVGRAAGREHCMGSPPSNGARPTLISKAEMAEPEDADIGKIANNPAHN